MGCLRKKIVVILLMIVAIFTVKLDAKAEIIYNTTGEKTPQGEEYYAKYWSGNQWRYYLGNSNDYPKCIDITYDVTYCYEEAYKMIDLVNAERRKAGVPELQVKDELMDAAMKRAAETAIYWSHTRPNGYSNSSVSMFIDGENIHAGSATAKEATESLVDSKGHYATMIDTRYSYAGFGCVKEGKTEYWVQIFSTANKYYENGYDYKHPENSKPVLWNQMILGNRKDYAEKFTAKVNPQFIDKLVVYGENETYVGQSIDLNVYTKSGFPGYGGPDYRAEVILSEDQHNVKVLTPDICSYSNGKIIGLKAGTGKLQVTLNADPSKKVDVIIQVKNQPIKKGSTVILNGYTYKVTCAQSKTITLTSGKKIEIKSRTVSLISGRRNAKTASIPATVKIQGKNYKVTSVAAGAFKNNKNLKSVTIGSNVKSIEKEVFYGCKNLKKVTVKSQKLTSVGKNALKGVHKKAVIKVPKSRYTKYKKLFKNKGQRKTVTIKK